MAFKRWQNVPEIQDEVGKLETAAKKYYALLATGKTEDKIQAQKVWQAMSASYWDILFVLVDTQTKASAKGLAFDAEEKLFIDTGFVNGVLTLSKSFDPKAFLSAKCPAGILPVMTFSDYIAETWAAILGRPAPVPQIGMSLDDRIAKLTENLDSAQAARDSELAELVSSFDLKVNASQFSQVMNDTLIPGMKVTMRVPEYREGDEEFRQGLSQKRKVYADVENAMILELNSARKREDNQLPAMRLDKFLQLHETTKVIAREILYSQMDAQKILRRNRKITESCTEMSPQMKRGELRNMLMKKRDYLTVPAKNARADTSLLCVPESMPTDYAKSYAILEDMCRMDMPMFNVPRVRMYGMPRVVFVPGQGLGTYDWSDHTLLLPAFPLNGEDKSVSYALATFRWDSDEDRKMKTPYEQIKENKKKSMLALASSFYKDYSLWMTKEKKGYRILPAETHKAFVQMFAQKADD